MLWTCKQDPKLSPQMPQGTLGEPRQPLSALGGLNERPSEMEDFTGGREGVNAEPRLCIV
eukprot:1395460-Lingulodinium_polyedra.AAC.1